jgi:hypothetical protein
MRTLGSARGLVCPIASGGYRNSADLSNMRLMDWRADDRKPLPFQVRATAFANPEFSASGEVLDVSESGISVYLPLQFTPGTLVCITIKDSLLHGSVLYSIPERSFFRTGIELNQVLIGSSNSSQLLKATLKEAMPELQMRSA